MASKDLAVTDDKPSIMPKLVIGGLALVGGYVLIGWLLSLLSFVFSLTFLVVVLAIAVVVLWVKLRRARTE